MNDESRRAALQILYGATHAHLSGDEETCAALLAQATAVPASVMASCAVSGIAQRFSAVIARSTPSSVYASLAELAHDTGEVEAVILAAVSSVLRGDSATASAAIIAAASSGPVPVASSAVGLLSGVLRATSGPEGPAATALRLCEAAT